MSRVRNRPSWKVEPPSGHHGREHFSCGNAALDRYFREQSSQDQRRGCAMPYVLVDSNEPAKVLGFYTLSSYGIDAGELPPEVIKKLPRYPLIPATLLGRLAVSVERQGQGIGEFLLIDALRRAWEQSQHVASAAVVVDAIDERAAKFDRYFGFVEFPRIQNRLFLPMRTVGQAVQ